MHTIDPRELRSAFGSFMTGVTVVTSVSSRGERVGFTANSFTSVSLDPPLLLVSLAKTLSSTEVFRESRRFAVNILAENQQLVSTAFASAKDDRFSVGQWSQGPAGSPILGDVCAWFDCEEHDWIDAGDHYVLIGRVLAFQYAEKAGLGYNRNGYFRLGLERKAGELQGEDSSVWVGAIVERDGRVLLVPADKDGTMTLPGTRKRSRHGSIESLKDALQSVGLDLEFGPIYSIYDNEQTGEHRVYYRVEDKSGAEPKRGQWYSLDALPLDKVKENSVKIMMNRYRSEYEAKVFGVYFGTDLQGEVQIIGRG